MTATRQNIAVQGLGFVGSAMAVATAIAKDDTGAAAFTVTGVDLPTEAGQERVDALNAGAFPFTTTDRDLVAATSAAIQAGNLKATTDPAAYDEADIVIVDVHLDVDQTNPDVASVDFTPFKSAIRAVGKRIRPGTLVIVETTVAPGTCKTIVAPELEACFRDRGLPEDGFLLAHSYERVMPGEQYLDSIRNFWRVYSGHTPEAADRCEAFLSRVIDTDRYPLTRLDSTTASELSKIMENAYRAVNIAFVEEWSRLAENTGVDLYQVIDAIRVRPTHNNLRQPGFGVGGYCLTKDPLLAEVAANQLFDLPQLRFPFSRIAMETNRVMPLETLRHLEEHLGGLTGKRLLLLGVTYRQDVGDTRFSPSETFLQAAVEKGARVDAYDPCADDWPEVDLDLLPSLPSAGDYDAAILAVPHRQFRELDYAVWLSGSQTLLFDANNVLDQKTLDALQGNQCRIAGIGRG